MTNYAFCDVDQTIYDGYSMADFYLSSEVIEMAGKYIYEKDLEIGKLYKSGKITYGEAGLRAAKLSASTVKGMKVEDVQEIANNFIKNKEVKPFVVPLFDLLHQHNFSIVLVSGSVNFVTRAIGDYCHADFVHATTPEVIAGRYTGNIAYMLDNEEKAILIKQKYDLDKGHILAFGDSTGDIPMLSLAHHSFVINPHQPEMNDIVLSHDNWYRAHNENIIDQVQGLLRKLNKTLYG